jgi:protein-tyrosine kinase
MSRIHEALKKAQEERSAQKAAQNSELPELVEAVSAPITPTAVEEAPEQVQRPASASTSGPLTFDTLLSRCRQGRWTVSPSSVVSASEENGTGAKSEVFRTLRTRLYQIRAVQPLRTLLVTSALPGDGKTFVTSNLAYSISRQRERRTLLIDADLRLSNLHTPIGAERSPGLSDYLTGNADEVDVLQRGREENLFLISGGKLAPNPTELLSNGKLEQLLARMSTIFDWILIDSPPVIPVSDANIVAKMCDGILMVVRSGSTPFDLAQKACDGFQDRPLLGVVLNRTNPKEGYGGYYYKGYSPDTQKRKQQDSGTGLIV